MTDNDILFVVVVICGFFTVLWVVAWIAEGRAHKRPKAKPPASG